MAYKAGFWLAAHDYIWYTTAWLAYKYRNVSFELTDTANKVPQKYGTGSLVQSIIER